MKTLASILLVLTLAISQLPLRAQGIINGGFELYDPVTRFLVGWNVRFFDGAVNYGAVIDGVAGSLVPFDERAHQGFYATIYGKDSDPGGLPIGNYYLFGRGEGSKSIIAEQTVRVPDSTRTLQYRAFRGYLGGVRVEIDGVELAPQEKTIITPGGFHGKVSDWWVDMSAYAGRDVHLLFALGDVGVALDEARFSTEPIPEPSTLAVFALGCLALMIYYRRHVSDQH